MLQWGEGGVDFFFRDPHRSGGRFFLVIEVGELFEGPDFVCFFEVSPGGL